MQHAEPVIDVKLLKCPVRPVEVDPILVQGGGECVFIGRTRRDEHPTHGLLIKLSYEAYESLAVQTLHQLALEAAKKFDCTLVRVHHALGEVAPGHGSVLVQVVCRHRAASFDACRFLLDELKSRVPIWKREQWADGSTWASGCAVEVPQ